ncbi:calmodulin isoform X4 [Arachis hypogaea]|uniref:calmodulin isoform X4 n=2 Tax=Arachis TaxID=3817 RepID=UPI003B225737|nr:Calmodulin [Arachis hypogaea]
MFLHWCWNLEAKFNFMAPDALTEDQVAEFREAFSFIDKDHDGFISVDELATIIKSLEGNATKEEIQHMISEVDIDGSGSIDFEEFINIMATKMKAGAKVNISAGGTTPLHIAADYITML